MRWAGLRHVGVVLAAAVLVVVTAQVLRHGWLTRVDRRVADWTWAHDYRHGSLPRAMVVYAGTMPGDPRGVAVLVAPFVGWVAWRRRSWQPVLRFGVTVGVLLVVIWAYKAGVGRTAPGLVDQVRVGGRSFPSGHTVTAVAMSGLVARLAVDGELPLVWRRLLVALAWLAPLATAAGMVLLVYHWLSDVLAGLALGVLVLRVVDLIPTRRLRDWDDASRRDPVGAGGRRAAVRPVDAGPG